MESDYGADKWKGAYFTMKRLLVLTLVALLLMGTLNLSASAASHDYVNMSIEDLTRIAKEEESGKIVFSAWWGEDFWNMFAKDFESKYGIKVDIAFGDSKPVLDKIMIEKDAEASTIDVVLIGGSSAKTAMDAQLMLPNLLNAIEGGDHLDKGLAIVQEGVVHNGTFVPVYLNQTGLVYNSEKIAESDQPQTWEQLEAFIDANPGRFAFCDPTTGGSGQAFVHSAINLLAGGLDKYAGDTEVVEDKIADWSKVWQWINDREDKIVITSSNSDSLAKINSGECYLAAAWDDDCVNFIKKGELMKEAKLYIPDFKMAGGGDTIAVVNNSKNIASSILFINELVSTEGQAAMTEGLSSLPARIEIPCAATLVPAEDLSANRLSWFPAAYKVRMGEDFVKYVLMQ